MTTLLVFIGAMITLLAHRAANRHSSPALPLFSYGFGTISLGFLFGGAGSLLFGLDVERTLFVQGVLVAPGFALLLRSRYTIPRRSAHDDWRVQGHISATR